MPVSLGNKSNSQCKNKGTLQACSHSQSVVLCPSGTGPGLERLLGYTFTSTTQAASRMNRKLTRTASRRQWWCALLCYLPGASAQGWHESLNSLGIFMRPARQVTNPFCRTPRSGPQKDRGRQMHCSQIPRKTGVDKYPEWQG